MHPRFIPGQILSCLAFFHRIVMAAILLGAAVAVHASPAAVHTLGQAPGGLRAAVTKTLVSQAAADPAYAIGHNGCARLSTPGEGSALSGCFTRQGVHFQRGREQLGLRLSAYGRAGRLHPVSLTRTAPHANRIAYQAKGLREWWRVLPMGFEQGFTLDKAPAGHGKVVLHLTASSAPSRDHGNLAWGALRYGKLQVIDARGHRLPARLTTHGHIIALAFDADHARFPVTVDPTVWAQQKMTASNGAMYDELGYAVALSADGTTALVGAYMKTVSSNSNQGAAYIYTYSSSSDSWTQTAELTASNGASGDYFGSAVALSSDGTTALVGAYQKTVSSNSQQGAAYIFTKPNSGWATTSTYTAELTASNGAANDNLGSSVALSADGATALVGAYHKTISSNSQQGAAYIYAKPNSGWATTATYTAELTASNGAALDYFGNALALTSDGATALVGAYGKTVSSNSQQGVAYIYTKPNSGWATTATYTAELTASDGAGSDRFGYGLALSADGTTALVGAYMKTIGSNNTQGVAYIYTKPNSGWATTATYTAKLTASNGATQDYFGNAVALSADGATALVGADSKTVGSNNNQGATYLLTNPDLSVVLNAPATVTPTAYTVDYIVTNNGSDSSADLKVQLPLPSGTSYGSITATQGTCTYDSTTQVATCDLGRLAGGGTAATAELKLTPTVTTGSITQTASVYGSPTLTKNASSSAGNFALSIGKISDISFKVKSQSTVPITLTGTGTLTVTVTSKKEFRDSFSFSSGATSSSSNCVSDNSYSYTTCTLTLQETQGTFSVKFNDTYTGGGSSNNYHTVTVKVSDTYGQTATRSFKVNVTQGSSGASSLWALLGLGALGMMRRRRA